MFKSKTTGGMHKNWLSNIGRSAEVTAKTKAAGDLAKGLATAKARVTRRSGYSYHYGSIEKMGTWGLTYVFWPTTPIAKARPEIMKASAEAVGARPKGGTN